MKNLKFISAIVVFVIAVFTLIIINHQVSSQIDHIASITPTEVKPTTIILTVAEEVQSASETTVVASSDLLNPAQFAQKAPEKTEEEKTDESDKSTQIIYEIPLAQTYLLQ